MVIAENGCTTDVRDVSVCADAEPDEVLQHSDGSSVQATRFQLWIKRVDNGD